MQKAAKDERARGSPGGGEGEGGRGMNMQICMFCQTSERWREMLPIPRGAASAMEKTFTGTTLQQSA